MEGRVKAAKAQLSLLKRICVVGNPTWHLGRYLGPIMTGEEAGPSRGSSMGGAHRRSVLKPSSLLLSYVLDLSCELQVGIEGVGVPSDLQFQSFPPTSPSLMSINQQMGLLELGDITHSHFHFVFISVKNPSCCSLFSARSPRMRWRCLSSDLASEIEQQLDPQPCFSSGIGGGCKPEETRSRESTVDWSRRPHPQGEETLSFS